jgi:hypothetical protein
MPRTFSRGRKWSALDLVFRLPQYLTVSEGEQYLKDIRLLHCPEQPLIEQDIFELLEDLRDSIKKMHSHILDIHINTAITQTDRNTIFRWIDDVDEISARLNDFNKAIV